MGEQRGRGRGGGGSIDALSARCIHVLLRVHGDGMVSSTRVFLAVSRCISLTYLAYTASTYRGHWRDTISEHEIALGLTCIVFFLFAQSSGEHTARLPLRHYGVLLLVLTFSPPKLQHLLLWPFGGVHYSREEKVYDILLV